MNQNNNKFSKNRSKSISNLSEIIVFNKSSNKNENHNNNIKKFSNQKKNYFKIRKEVRDVLNNYNNIIKNNDMKEIENYNYGKNEIKFKKKFKQSDFENLIKKKKKKIKKEKIKNIFELKNENNNSKNQEESNGEIKEKMIEKKMYLFFKKIKNLKNSKIKNYEEELKAFIDEEIDKISDMKSKDWENRINSFYREFELNRKKLYFFNKFKKRDLIFVSPITFFSRSIEK